MSTNTVKLNTIKLIVTVVLTTLFKTSFAGGPPCSAGSGSVIIDNTESSTVVAIGANLGFRCDDKDSTAIDDGYGGNAINITDFQVLQRVPNTPADKLQVFIGNSADTVSDFNLNTANQFDFFAQGKHLFDLDRLRLAADWITTNATVVAPKPGVTAGTYGTISMQQFLANIAADKTMYGIVRVIVPLEAGNSSSTLNALKQTVTSGSLYGFCSSSVGLCSCSPGTSFSKIEPSVTICGQSLPATAKIKVKGSLFWDFVDSVDGHSLELAELPFVPRELYFKVITPVMVNWAHDINDDGAMDNMSIVRGYSLGSADADFVNATYNYADVPQESKNAYQDTHNGTALTSALFAALDPATKYHMMLPSGYAEGWAEAFDKLNITADDWKSIPALSTRPFRVPKGVAGIMVANDIRSDEFEDIPTYLYSGGLIDMHHHVNVSGLVYVPQGMELEAKDASARQYVSGAVIVRDTFYIQANSGTITIISSDPKSYSTIRRSPASVGSGSSSPTLLHSGAAYQGADPGSTGGGSAGGTTGGGGTPGNVNWQEIHPQ